jgi:hypothetical protein
LHKLEQSLLIDDNFARSLNYFAWFHVLYLVPQGYKKFKLGPDDNSQGFIKTTYLQKESKNPSEGGVETAYSAKLRYAAVSDLIETNLIQKIMNCVVSKNKIEVK